MQIDNGIVFNGKKTNCLVFKPRKLRSPEPVLCLNNTEIKIVNEVKYLGFVLDSYLRDDCDIKRQTRAVYCIANNLRSNFFLCSKHVKNVLYRSYCMPMYGCQLWCDFYSYNYNPIKVAYNNTYSILHNISRSSSVRYDQVQDNIATFDALIRKRQYSFLSRCNKTRNNYIESLTSSDVLFLPKYLNHHIETCFL